MVARGGAKYWLALSYGWVILSSHMSHCRADIVFGQEAKSYMPVFSRNFAKLRHTKMRWFLLFIRISNAGEYKYFISLESLGGGQRDSMKNWIFKIPDFCLKPLSPVTYIHKHVQNCNTQLCIKTNAWILLKSVPVPPKIYFFFYFFFMWKGHSLETPLHQHSVKNIHQVMK